MDTFDKLAQELINAIRQSREIHQHHKLAALLRARLEPLVEFSQKVHYIHCLSGKNGVTYLYCGVCRFDQGDEQPQTIAEVKHAPDCPRQLALAAFENVTPEKK